jgi:hypothetical protein
MAYQCGVTERREAVRQARDSGGNPFLNGLDFLEVDANDQRTLDVAFLHDLPAGGFLPANFVVTGGERIRGITVTAAVPTGNDTMRLTVDQAGDHSQYTLSLVVGPGQLFPPDGFDPLLTSIAFSFKVHCPSPFDCKTDASCPPEPVSDPNLDYLAKDYQTFRRLVLDRLSQLVPGWNERNPADLGVTLAEVLAYAGDLLSYKQDSISTEAYLATARLRTSARRHARLVDYFMHDGSNARAFVQVRVTQDLTSGNPAAPRLTAGTRFLTRTPGLDVALAPDDNQLTLQRAVRHGALVFESVTPLQSAYREHNQMRLYAWGASSCCLPGGATSAVLAGRFANLRPGMFLILREAIGPHTGEAADADPAKRHVVRLVDVVNTDRHGNPLADPLTAAPITNITWHAEDALPFPMCLSAVTDAGHGSKQLHSVTVVLGNVVLADQGRTIGSPFEDAVDEVLPQFGSVPRIYLTQGPLTFAAPNPYTGEAPGALRSAAVALKWEPTQCKPAIVQLSGPAQSVIQNWIYFRDMFTANANDFAYTVEPERDGISYLRFGDVVNGFPPDSGAVFRARYRVGNGVAGNIGYDSLAHMLLPTSGIAINASDIESVSNPMPAFGGLEPESVPEVRRAAPEAFKIQDRAVTLADYADFSARESSVERAAATMRWTGSWHTVFVTVERFNSVPVDAAYRAKLIGFLDRFRMAGQDLEIGQAKIVALEAAMHVCVTPGYFQADVHRALLDVFSSRVLPGGSKGLFHPDNFHMGERFYVSWLYAAAQRVAGVASVSVTLFQRQDQPGLLGLTQGYLQPGPLEVFALDNNPDFPDRGVFTLSIGGGK